jgi:hypothetical protein
MTDILNFNVIRVFDDNGIPASGAKATFFDAGTSTPRTVYSDAAGTIPHPSPLVADSEGVFPAVFVSGSTAVKVNVTDAADVTLTGYPIDPAILVAADGGAAALVSFSPTTEIPQDNVQDAIEQVQTNLEASYNLGTVTDAATARTNLGLGTAAVVDVIDEDSFATDSATRPPSQQSTKAYALSLRKVVQVVASQTGASSSTSSILPDDNTVPQNTEGAEFLSQAITPTSATNILQIDVVLCGSINNNRNLVVALFQDSTAGALAAASTYQGSTGELVTVTFRHRMTAGTTSATTFKVRAGAGASTGTLTVNGRFGGVAASSITITELTA